jgi:hypothetical protein
MPPELRGRGIADRYPEVPDASLRSVIPEPRPGGETVAAPTEPWNVTIETSSPDAGMPLNGTAPHLWPLGFKSSGRQIMRAAGVPSPLGHEDVQSVDGIVAAALPSASSDRGSGVVIKTDNSGTGDGTASCAALDTIGS